MTRKEKLDRIVTHAAELNFNQRSMAWSLLVERLNTLAYEGNPHIPKYKDLTLAIFKASLRANMRIE